MVRHTNYFENDFFYLKKIFRNRKINIIDVGASDGISAQFFIKNLNPKYIFCYEPQKIFFKKLVNLKKKYKMLKIFNYGLGEKNTITNNSIKTSPYKLKNLNYNECKNKEPTGIGKIFKSIMLGSKELLKLSSLIIFIYGIHDFPLPA